MYTDKLTYCFAKRDDNELDATNICNDLDSEGCLVPCCLNACSDIIAPVVVIVEGTATVARNSCYARCEHGETPIEFQCTPSNNEDTFE